MIAADSAPQTAMLPGETPYQAIARWARQAPPGRLAFWLMGAGSAAVGLVLVLPRLWILALGLVALAAIGAWGLAAQAESRLAPDRRWARGLLLAARILSAVVGTAAAIVGFYGLLLVEAGQGWGPSGG